MVAAIEVPKVGSTCHKIFNSVCLFKFYNFNSIKMIIYILVAFILDFDSEIKY